jgi:hypothetical protein
MDEAPFPYHHRLGAMRIRFDFGSVTLDAETLATPTAKAIAGGAADDGLGDDLGRGGLFRYPGERSRAKRMPAPS